MYYNLVNSYFLWCYKLVRRATSKVTSRHSAVMPTIDEKTKSLISSTLNVRTPEKVTSIDAWDTGRQGWGEPSSPHPSDE